MKVPLESMAVSYVHMVQSGRGFHKGNLSYANFSYKGRRSNRLVFASMQTSDHKVLHVTNLTSMVSRISLLEEMVTCEKKETSLCFLPSFKLTVFQDPVCQVDCIAHSPYTVLLVKTVKFCT